MRDLRLPRSSWLILLLWAAGAAVYANSLQGIFVFDDLPAILYVEDRLQQLWPPWAAGGNTLRFFLYWTLAVNYALSGFEPWSYHVVNALIHVLAATCLYLCLERLLRAPRVGWDEVPARGVAFATALLWVVHPLNTQAVTYVIQRGESLAGLLCLASLWAFLRADAAPERRVWPVAVVGLWWLALLSKESAAALLAVLAAVDILVLSGSPREAWKRRRGLWLALVVPVVLGGAYLLAVAPGKVAGFLDGDSDASRWDYARTQLRVLAEYLRLSAWPHPLRIDHDWPSVTPWGRVLPAALPVLALAAATLWGAWRRRPVAAIGAWFLLFLAPTSTIVPLQDVLVEHRMYLPLAAVILAVVLVVHAVLPRQPRRRRALAAVMLGGTTVVLGALTVGRNADYGSELAMFGDPEDRTDGARQFYNLQLEFILGDWGVLDDLLLCTGDLGGSPALRPAIDDLARGDAAAALARLEPMTLDAAGLNLRGICLWQLGRRDAAVTVWRQAVDAGSTPARVNLACGLTAAGDIPPALEQLRAAVAERPDLPEASYGLGSLLARQGHDAEALPWLRQALEARPQMGVAANNLGAALIGEDAVDEARRYFQRAAELDHPMGHLNLALWMLVQRNYRVLPHLLAALEADPANFRARNGRAMVRYYFLNFQGALDDLEIALQVAPERADLHNNVGCVLFASGELAAAEAAFRRAVERDPELSGVWHNLGKLLVVRGRSREAVPVLRTALRLSPEDRALRANLERAESMAR